MKTLLKTVLKKADILGLRFIFRELNRATNRRYLMKFPEIEFGDYEKYHEIGRGSIIRAKLIEKMD